MVFCSSCGKELGENENFCSSCGGNVNQTSSANVVTQKRSNFWYLAPILIGIIGGLFAFFVLRNSDPSKAKKCLIIGIVITVIGAGINVAVLASVPSLDNPNLPTSSSERIVIPNPEPVVSPKQSDLEISNTNRFDPEMVKTAKENIPKLQGLPREMLTQCRAVDSYSDYQTFGTVAALLIDDLTDTIREMDIVLTALELQGYDEHPEVGPLIEETRRLSGETSRCIDDLIRKYEN